MQNRVYKHKKHVPGSSLKPIQTEYEIRRDAHRFLRAHVFIETLRRYSGVLTRQEYLDLREQALNGEIEAAKDKLDTILTKKTRFEM